MEGGVGDLVCTYNNVPSISTNPESGYLTTELGVNT